MSWSYRKQDGEDAQDVQGYTQTDADIVASDWDFSQKPSSEKQRELNFLPYFNMNFYLKRPDEMFCTPNTWICSHASCLLSFDTQLELISHETTHRVNAMVSDIQISNLNQDLHESLMMEINQLAHSYQQIQGFEAASLTDNPFVCSVCWDPFTWRPDLKRHKGAKSQKYPPEPWICSCSRKFRTHEQLDSQETSRNILDLHKKFIDFDESTENLTAINNLLALKYFVPQSSAPQQSSVLKGYACEICKKSFGRKQDLKRHGAIHAKTPKQYLCVVCKSLFTRNDALQRHSKTGKCSSFS